MSHVSPETLLRSEAHVTGPTRMSRVRGALLMAIGPMLCVAMLWALASLGPELLSAAPTSSSGARFTGTAEQGQAAVLLFAWVALLGVLFTLGGWQLWRHGKLGRRVGVPAALLVSGLFAAMPWLRHLFG